jgi:hypothetical protein
MKFSLEEWLTIYKLTQEKGQILKDSYPQPDSNNKKRFKPPIKPLSPLVQKLLIMEIKELTMKARKYLNDCDMRMPDPLWIYDIENNTTWASHENFKYKHLQKFNHQRKRA